VQRFAALQVRAVGEEMIPGQTLIGDSEPHNSP
jgi:hypothetical protein